MEMGKTLLYLRNLSLRTWLVIVAILLVLAVALWWFVFHEPVDIGFPALNQEVGKQKEIMAQKDREIAAKAGQVQGLQAAYGVLAKQKTQIVQEIQDVKPPQSDDELIARAAAVGLHIYRKGGG
jgi:hypothetical protein